MRERPPSILIAEDENVVASSLEQSLASLGYRIAGVVNSAKDAIQLAEQALPDLALMDLQLKGSIDGVAAAGEISGRLKIPIVFLTAKGDQDTLARANTISPYGYIVKPFRSSELNAAISLALNQHRLVQELFAGQAWFGAMLQCLNDAVIATDDQGRVRLLNTPAEALTGWSSKEAIGLPIENIYRLSTLAGQESGQCQLRAVLLGKNAIFRQRCFLKNRKGRIFPVEDSAAPIMERGRLLGAVAIFRDITDLLTKENALTSERDRLEEQMQMTAEALGHTRSELEALSEHLIATHDEERQRVAETLHDDFSQRTAVLGLEVDHLAKLLQDDTEAQKHLEAIHTQIAGLSNGLRDTAHILHPSVLSDLGLLHGLRSLVQYFQQIGLDVSLHAKETLPNAISPEVSTALYRIAQEALGNAVKQAKGANIRITIWAKDGTLHLGIEDAGSSFDLVQSRVQDRLGILSMQERARMAGGSLLVRTADGKGTQVVVRVPLV